jgi:hypothetical protein
MLGGILRMGSIKASGGLSHYETELSYRWLERAAVEIEVAP